MLDSGWNARALLNLAPGVEVENTNNLGKGKKYSRFKVPGGGYIYPAYDLNHAFEDTDVFMSMAKLKNHETCGVTLSLKNCFGNSPASIYGDDAKMDEPNENPTSGRGAVYDQGRVEEANYRQLVENASDIIYAHDLEGRFTWVNRACERVTGYTREEALRMRIWDLVAPEHLERVRGALEKKGAHDVQLLEVEIVAKDGRRVPLELTSRLVYQGLRPVGVQGIARDVSERVQAAQALHSSEDKFRALVDTGKRLDDFIEL